MSSNHPCRHLKIEALEPRIAPATFAVVNSLDAGPGSLRQAILDANATPGSDEIVFHHGTAAGGSTPLKVIINLSSDLPAITDGVVIHDASITGVGRQNVQIDGHHHEIFAIQNLSDGISVTIADLKLTNGQSSNGGAIMAALGAGSVTLDNLKVTHNRAVGHVTDPGPYRGLGGGIALISGSGLVTNCRITDNTAVGFNGTPGISGAKGDDGGSAFGGGIEISDSASLTVRDSIISRNLAIGGTGGRGSNGGRLVDAWLATAGADGGASLGGGIFNFGELTVEHTQIKSNLSQGGLGGTGGRGENAGPNAPVNGHYDGGAGGNGGAAIAGGLGNFGMATVTG